MDLHDRHLLLMLGSGAFAIVMPVLLLWQDQDPLPIATWAQPTPLSIVTPQTSGTSERQLFVAGTQPSAGADSAPQPPGLVGIAIGARGNGVAVVRLASGDTQNLAIGEMADGWTLTALTRMDATFTGPAGPITLGLDFADRASAQGGSADDRPPITPNQRTPS